MKEPLHLLTFILYIFHSLRRSEVICTPAHQASYCSQESNLPEAKNYLSRTTGWDFI